LATQPDLRPFLAFDSHFYDNSDGFVFLAIKSKAALTDSQAFHAAGQLLQQRSSANQVVTPPTHDSGHIS
jgi:hypothetical protein